ncbi:winged helix-turn-helix domain-containing protein [Staphylococcus chromogenes]
MRTLRKKVELTPNTPELIQTARGKGYIYRGLINE